MRRRIYESGGGNIDVFIDFHELLMERKFCAIFPQYKNTKYVQNNCHLKKIVIFKISCHTVTKLDTLLCGTGHIYIYTYMWHHVAHRSSLVGQMVASMGQPHT